MLIVMMVVVGLLVALALGLSWRAEAQRQGVRIGWLWLPVMAMLLLLGSGLYLWRGLHADTDRWLADWYEYRDFARQVVAGEPDPERAAEIPLQSLARVLQRQLLLTPSAEGWYILSLVYSEMEAPAVAVTAARRAVEISDGALEPRLLLARSLIESDEGRLNDESTAILDAVLAEYPEHDGALTLLASAAMQSRDFARALDAWQSLLARHGDGEARPLLERMIETARTQRDAQRYFDNVSVTVNAPAELAAGGTLFVFLRRPGDQGQPLAAVRVLADRFPFSVTLGPADWLQQMPVANTPVLVGARYNSAGGGGVEAATLEASPVPAQGEAGALQATLNLAVPAD